jgi:hypothetical protein
LLKQGNTILVPMRVTVLTKNNFSFLILHALNLVRTGFGKWGKKILHNLKFLLTQAIKN